MINVGTFNMLADRLASNEFMCESGDEISVLWSQRRDKLINIINNMLQQLDIVATQENDKHEDIIKDISNNIGFIIFGNDIVVYYNKNTINLISFEISNYLSLFQKDNKFYNIYSLHLKSGEDIECERKRCLQLSKIFNDAENKENVIILMDSNNSNLYEFNYPFEDRLSTLIESNGYKNAIKDQKGNECLKLRHNKGNQSSKFFNFMFDTIDKILVRYNTEVINKTEVKDFGFKRFNSEDLFYNILLTIRINFREQLKEWCLDHIKTTDTFQEFNNESIFRQLYPNKNAPSDHPPISVCLLFN